MTNRLKNVLLITAALGLCGVALSGCNEPPAPQQREVPAHRVEVTPVGVQSLGITQVRTGTLRARKHVRLHNQEAGRITDLPVYEGDRVQQDQLLVQLDDRLLKAELAKAQANRHQAQEDLARVQRLSQKNLISQDEKVRALTALEVTEAEVKLLQTRLSYTRILSPFAGIITERLAEPGDAVPAYEHLLSLADPDSLITELRVSELLHSQLDTGAAVRVSIDALGAETFTGHISRIHPTVDPLTRQGIIEVLLEPVPAGARAGQLCRVSITSPASEKRVIPLQALRRDNQGDYVFVISDNQAQRRSIHTGATFEQWIEVLDGLSDGEQVVTKGFLGLADGSTVAILPAKDSDG